MKRIAIGAVLIFAGALAACWVAGSLLAAPHHATIGALPADLPGRDVSITSASGAALRGWFVPGRSRVGVVVLLHGVRADRLSMLDRARFLHAAGFAVLLCDFQAHGESTGGEITFGYLESRDARSEVQFIRREAPGERIGIVGTSLGGAAAVLASPPIGVDAMVLESVYPTIEDAISDRITSRLGKWADVLTPLLTIQLRPRLGIGPSDLRPIDRVAGVQCPKLFIAGTADRSTTIAESERLYRAARAPKELWEVEGAGHQDLNAFAPAPYRDRVLAFLRGNLSR